MVPEDDRFEKEEARKLELAMNALSAFCNLYDPANDKTATDYFSSREIQKIISDHTGFFIDVSTINDLLTKMNYKYSLNDNVMNWMVRKV